MRPEVLRMERVTVLDHTVKVLDNFNFQMFKGEIMGLVPMDSMGLADFLGVLAANPELYYGFVYLNGKKVNSYEGRSQIRENNIQIISTDNNLVNHLSAADNVFALRKGYKSFTVNERIFREQLRMHLSELDLDFPPELTPKAMTPFQRYVTEILKAVVSQADLIVLLDPNSMISREDLSSLYRILRFYAGKGESFLYITADEKELCRVCDRVSILRNGRIIKVADHAELSDQMIESFQKTLRTEKSRMPAAWQDEVVFRCDHLEFGSIRSLSFRVRKGECLVIYDQGGQISNDLAEILVSGKLKDASLPQAGEPSRNARALRRRIGIILDDPTESMLYENMSYVDNLCMTLDHTIPKVWGRFSTRKKIAEASLGDGFPDWRVPVKYLSLSQKYDLVYNRILLQKPDVVFIFHPFQNINVQLREQVQLLMRSILERGIAIVLITVNYHDGIPLADSLLTVRDGKSREVLSREQIEPGLIS